jgi:hypothetical protein
VAIETIDTSATDQSDLASTSTRPVIIESPPQPLAPPPSSDPSTA